MALDAIQDIAGIVLAAGAGRRMGYRPKALLQRDGQPLVARQIGLLAQCSVRRIMVVLGHHAARIAPVLATTATALPGVDLNWVVNPTPDEGTGASLRCALAALPADLTGVMVVLAAELARAATLLQEHGTAFRQLVRQLLADGAVPAATFGQVTGLAVRVDDAQGDANGPEPWHARWEAFAGN